MVSLLQIVIMACIASTYMAEQNYTGHSVIRITPNLELTSDTLHKIQSFVESDTSNLEILSDHIMAGQASQIRVGQKIKNIFKSLLNELNIEHSTTTEDLQKDIDEENDAPSEYSSSFNLNKYHRLSEISSHLHSICNNAGQPCKLRSIGKSYEKRDLNVIQVGDDHPNKKVIWIDGGIHAREWISPATALNLLTKFLEKTSYMDKVLQTYVIFVMPNLNPDGYDYSWKRDRLWRKTRKPNRGSRCVGTDANRNWGYKWGGQGSSPDPCSNTYHGTKAFSEPETDAVQRFLAQFRQRLALFLSIHSHSQCWLIPFGYTYDVLPDNYKDHVYVAKKAARAQYMATRMNHHVVEAGHLSRLSSGESYDWGKAVANADFSYIIELRFRRRYGFTLPARYIDPTGREMWAALKAMFDAMRELER